MSRVAAGIVGLALALASVDGRCIVLDPCQSSIVVTAPYHPAADEPVALRISSGLAFTPGTVIMGRARLVSGVIVLDVVVTDDTSGFPGYKRTAPMFQDPQAFIGPLAPGVYPIHATIRSATAAVESGPCVLRAFSVAVTAAGGAVTAVQAQEYFNATLDRYIVVDDQEAVDLDTGVHPGWSPTGEGMAVYLAGGSDGRGQPVCRFLGVAPGNLGSHFLTARAEECIAMRAPPLSDSWILESGDAFEAPLPDALSGECPYGSAPVYRFWNPRNGDHRYVVSPALRGELLCQGWIAEGYGPDAVALCTARRPLS
jgi:hypothetical protein